MSPKTRTPRKRRTTKRSAVSRRGMTRPAGVRQRPDVGANFNRLVRARVLERDSARILGPTALTRLEELTRVQVQTLIDVANKVGRRPRCWFI
jgi:hypothetical protein